MSEEIYYQKERISTNNMYNESDTVDPINFLIKEPDQSLMWEVQAENIIWYNGLLLIFDAIFPKRKTFEKIKTIITKSTYIKRLAFVLTYIFQTILGLIIFAAAIPIVLPIWVIFTMISEVSRLKLLSKYGQKAIKAVGIDALWGADQPVSRPFISALFTMKGQADIQKIRGAIQENILDIRDKCGAFKYRKFRQEFGREFGYIRWKDCEDFHVDNHVKLLHLHDLKDYRINEKSSIKEQINYKRRNSKKENGNETNISNEIMFNFCKNHDTSSLGINKPPWELFVLQRPDNKYSAILKIHHAIGDGVSLIRLLLEALVDCPLDFGKPEKEVGKLLKITTTIWSLCLLPFAMFRMINNSDRHSLHGSPLTGDKIFRLSNKINLNDVKKVKTITKTTVNDVLMCCLSKAVSEYFKRSNSGSTNTTFLVPVNFHNMNEENTLSNKFSAAIIKLPTPQNVSSLQRLELVKKTLDKVKSDPTTISVYRLLKSFFNVVPPYITEILFVSKGITGAASNLPGPQKVIKVWGDTLEDFAFWVPDRTPAGIGFSIFSYCGRITVGFSADTGIIKDPKQMDEILHDFEREIDQLVWSLSTNKENIKNNVSVV